MRNPQKYWMIHLKFRIATMKKTNLCGSINETHTHTRMVGMGGCRKRKPLAQGEIIIWRRHSKSNY